MLLAMALALMFGGSKPAAVSIYVGPHVRDGFVDVDQGVLGSIKDIQNELRKNAAFSVVTKESDAVLKLFVVERGVGPSAGGGSTLHVPGTVLTFPNGQTIQTPGTSFHFSPKHRHVAALLRVEAYERPFVGEDSEYDTWKRCAHLLARDISAWLAANRERIDLKK